MKSALYNLGPLLGVLGVVAWMCWPHVVNYGSSPLYRGGEKLVRIDKKQLDPQIPGASKRNPFQPLSPPPQEAAAEQRWPSREDAKPVLEPEIDWQKIAQSLTLSGTSSGGGNPCVLINGQVYSEGSQVPTPYAGVFCTVTRVLEDGVVLEAGERQVRLTYASLTVSGTRELDGTSPRLPFTDSDAGGAPSGLMKWLDPFARSLRANTFSYPWGTRSPLPKHASHPPGVQDVEKPATDRPLEP